MDSHAARQSLNRHDLVQLLNWELAAYEHLAGCRFTAIRAMADADDSGCNWRDARLHADHPLDPAERTLVREVVEQTRRAFNLG